MSRIPAGKLLFFARALAQFNRQNGAEEAEEPQPIPHGALFWAAQMMAAIRPLIVRARRDAFGRSEPPFDTADQVNDWLGRVYYPATREAPRHERGVAARALQPAEPPAVLNDRAGREAARIVSAAAERITQWTGWHEIAALGCILLRGYTVPDTYRWRTEGPTPGPQAFVRELDELVNVDYSLLFRRITLTLRPWQAMRPAFVQRILDEALTHLGQRRPRGAETLSDRNLLLLDAIALTGAMPPKSAGPGYKSGGKEYWKQVYGQWQALGGSKCQPDALAKRWERLPERFKQTLARVVSEDAGASGQFGKHTQKKVGGD